jgi:hypothetical protein
MKQPPQVEFGPLGQAGDLLSTMQSTATAKTASTSSPNWRLPAPKEQGLIK